jgi:hypothetical protein
MRVASCIVFVLALAAGVPSVFGADVPETPHLAFVTEYTRELAAIENIRTAAEQELKRGAQDQVFSTAIYSSTRFQSELRTQIDRLRGMRLNPPFEELIA